MAPLYQVSFEMMKDDPKTRLLSPAREAMLIVLFQVTKFPCGLPTQPGLRYSLGRCGE